MEIENTEFGTITMDGKTYEHDVVVRLSGEVVKRKKKLSVERQMDLDLDEYAPDDCHGLLGS
jgi:hypothetical protein